jgi:hypothetical protein
MASRPSTRFCRLPASIPGADESYSLNIASLRPRFVNNRMTKDKRHM